MHASSPHWLQDVFCLPCNVIFTIWLRLMARAKISSDQRQRSQGNNVMEKWSKSSEDCLKLEQNDYNDSRWKALGSLIQASNKGEWMEKPHGFWNHNLGDDNFIFPALFKPNHNNIIVSLSLLELRGQVLGLGHASFIHPFLQVVGVDCKRNI